MPRRPRHDEPDTWHHVYNRGIARRTLFERAADIRLFLAQVARAVRRGEIELHAYAVLTTHYHLLVRTRDGDLARAMLRVQTAYSRRFNRDRRRDGPLVRSRYGSRLVDTEEYRRVLVAYIDANPVVAGLSRTPGEYPYGSAVAYARAAGPRWLERSWVESVVRSACGASTCCPGAYAAAFPSASSARLRELAGRRSRRPPLLDSPEDLLGAAPARVREWMERKSLLADGTLPGEGRVGPGCVRAAIDAGVDPCARVRVGRKPRSQKLLVTVALERDLCGETYTAIGRRIRLSSTVVAKIYGQHERLMRTDSEYLETVARVASAALGGANR
jgi:hypothetical protein